MRILRKPPPPVNPLCPAAKIAYAQHMTDSSPKTSAPTPAIARAEPPAARNALFEYLDELNIPHNTHDHAPIFTVEEGRAIKAALPGGHTKNLFLKDKSGALFLICALGDTAIPVNRLHPVLGCKRLSFGKPELLYEVLGVTPGSVTLFALMNDRTARVTLILDAALCAHDIVNFHPLENTATTPISSADMIRFAEATGHKPRIMNFATLSLET